MAATHRRQAVPRQPRMLPRCATLDPSGQTLSLLMLTIQAAQDAVARLTPAPNFTPEDARVPISSQCRLSKPPCDTAGRIWVCSQPAACVESVATGARSAGFHGRPVAC